jgi:serine/threonine-protein kinase
MTAQRIAGRYEVVRLLGEGPLGKVYEVTDLRREGVPATLKIVRADATGDADLDRHLQDFEMRLKALQHAGINHLVDVGRTPLGLVYIASDYAAGENLRQLLARRGPLPDERVLAIARAILEPLVEAHALALPHGALHPGNVLLKSRVPATLEDPFGTAVVLLDHAQLELLRAARPASLAAYTAPEVQAGGPATPAADVFAVGRILQELASDRTDSDPELFAPPLQGLLARALAADPAQRFANAAEFLAALPAKPEPTDASAALAAARAQLDAAEAARAASEARVGELRQAHEHSLSTSFARLKQRDAALVEVRQALTAREAELAALRQEREAALAAPQAGRSTSPGMRALVGTLAAAVLLVSFLWWRERAATARAADSLLAGEAGGAQMLAAERQAHKGELAAKEREVETALKELETWKDSERKLREANGTLTAERDTALAEALAAKRSAEAQGAELAEGRERLVAAEVALGRARDPELIALDQLDRVLAALEEGDGRAARARYQALSVTSPDLEALAGLDRLTSVALALDEAQEAEGLLAHIERMQEAARALTDAAGDKSIASLAQSGWVRRESNARSKRISGALEALKVQDQGARVELSRELDLRWKDLMRESPDVAPREVLAIADWFADGRLAAFVDRLAAHLHATAERGDALELSGLLAMQHLEAWGDALESHAELARTPSAREVQLFRYARVWKHAPATEDGPGHAVDFQEEGGDPPRGGWRADLFLRARLRDPGSAWPGAVGSRFLYRSYAEIEKADAVTWQLDEVVEIGPAHWVFKRRFYREDGSFLSEDDVRVERRGRRFLEETRPGGPLLDLASERAFRASFVPGEDFAPPAELVDPAAWRAFRDELREAEPEALRYESGELTSWYSPIYGCLAVESPESFRRELAFAAPLGP